MKNAFSRLTTLIATSATALLLSACSGNAPTSEESKQGVSATLKVPSKKYPEYYPENYSEIVKKSKDEPRLLIYSNVAEYNWRDILIGFKAKYPWTKVSTLDLGPNEAFERYYSEDSAERKTADMIVVGAPDAWQRFAGKQELDTYVSPESSKVPDWSRPIPGLYTLATDPMLIIYNKILLKPSEYPTSLQQLANQATADPKRWKNKITTYDASSHSFAYAVHWAAVDHGKVGGWEQMERLGPLTRPESGGSTMLDKVMGGEYLAAFYTSGITVFPRMKDAGREKIMGWALPADGTPMMLRGMAITKAARSPNTAKLMLDYMLSHDGQVAAGNGGMTPYRPDVLTSEVPYLTYNAIAERLGGEDKMIVVGYSPEMVEEYTSFISRWNASFKSKH